MDELINKQKADLNCLLNKTRLYDDYMPSMSPLLVSPPRHMAKLDGNPEDSGSVGADGRLQKDETT